MNISDQVCSLELSKRLKEIGVKQESLFVWISIIKTGFDFVKLKEEWEPNSKEVGAFNYSAYTVAELGELLDNPTPNCILNYKQNDIYICAVGNGPIKIANFEDKNEANARAKMLIYLLENKLMELPYEL